MKEKILPLYFIPRYNNNATNTIAVNQIQASCHHFRIFTPLYSVTGYAWNYKYSRDKYYIKLQEKAKAEKKGLWKDSNAVDPWLWRKEKRK